MTLLTSFAFGVLVGIFAVVIFNRADNVQETAIFDDWEDCK